LETNTENEELTPLQIKGINLTVKSASKKFPFIKGWKFTKDYNRYKTQVYIDLFVDWEEAASFYGRKLNPFYKKDNSKYSSGILTFMRDNLNVTGPEFNAHIEESFSETSKIKGFLEEIYKHLPKEMIPTWQSEFNPNTYYPKNLGIDNFIQYNL